MQARFHISMRADLLSMYHYFQKSGNFQPVLCSIFSKSSMTGNTNGLISSSSTPPASLTINAMLLIKYPLSELRAQVGLAWNSNWIIWVHCQEQLTEQFCKNGYKSHTFAQTFVNSFGMKGCDSTVEGRHFPIAALYRVHRVSSAFTKIDWLFLEQYSDPLMALILPGRCRKRNYCSQNNYSSRRTAGHEAQILSDLCLFFKKKNSNKKESPEHCCN